MRDLVDELLASQVRRTLFGDDRPPTLGRLTLVRALGAGGMGTVFEAHDPKLDRRVAVKVLRVDGAEAGRRILDEARALGKLQHPNVVAVHDAAEEGDVVYVIMELAPGETLRAWLETPRTWRAVVDVMAAAGQGLAAAHRAGIVHRDFKPENVIIGTDRARLVDFGLAAVEGAQAVPAGTRGYMAPEVLAGAPASAASDQYAFGVTLRDAVKDPPAWLARAITRALADAPGDRWPSMEVLGAELRRDRRVRRWILAGAAAALVVGGGAGLVAHRARPAADPCGAGVALRDAAWPPAETRRLHGTIGASPWGARAIDVLDGYAVAWEASHRRVCEATRIARTQPEELRELRTRCLERGLDRLGALARELAAPHEAGGVRERLAAAALELPRPEACETLTDRARLALPEDPARRARVLEAERDIDAAWVAFALGDYARARTLTQEIETRTRDLTFAPLDAPLLTLRGSVEARIGDGEEARRLLEAALKAAAQMGDPALEVQIWARLLRGALFAGRPADVHTWAAFARAAAARAGLAGAEIDGIEGEALRGEGKLDEARALLERAIASSDPLRDDQRALVTMNLGAVDLAAGDASAAAKRFDEARALAEAALGPGHPELALYVDKKGAAARARGRVREALAAAEESLAMRRAAFAADDRAVATSLLHRAEALIEAGRIADARRDLDQAYVIRERVHGKDSPRLREIEAARAEAAIAAGEVVAPVLARDVAPTADSYRATLAVLADEPSVMRLRALIGLAKTGDRDAARAAEALRARMPEVRLK